MRAGKMIWFCMGLAVFYWLIESLMNALVFREGGLGQQIFSPDRNQFWTRLIVVSILLIFGIFSHFIIAELKSAQNEIRRLSRAVEQSPAVVVITDTRGNIEYVNPKFTEVTGYAFEEVRGMNPRVLKSGETPDHEYKELWDTITRGGEWRGEFHNKKKNGELYWESASISPIRSVDGEITHFMAIKEDITERKYAEQELLRAATHDALTGLFNRRYLMERLEAAIHAARRYGYDLSVCLCDLDHFKTINDTRGHHVGDDVLVAFGEIITGKLRAEDTAGRFGGDEFCLVFPHVGAAGAAACVERIRSALAERVFGKDERNPFSLTATFGIAQLDAARPDARPLLEAADQALYRAKEAGRNRVMVAGAA